MSELIPALSLEGGVMILDLGVSIISCFSINSSKVADPFMLYCGGEKRNGFFL